MIKLQQNVENTINLFDKLSMKYYGYLYTASIAKEAASKNVTFIPEYQEELMVFGLAIGYSKCSIDEYIKRLDEFVPMISSWAVCDTVCSN